MDEFSTKLKDIFDTGIKEYLAETDEEWNRIREGLANEVAKAYAEYVLALFHEAIKEDQDKGEL